MTFCRKILCTVPVWIVLAGCSSTNDSNQSSRAGMNIPSPNLPGAPLVPERSVLRPYFKTKLGQIPAGESAATAFAVSIEGNPKPIVLTALSTLAAGEFFSTQPTPNRLNADLEVITLSDAFGSMDGVVSARAFIEIPESGFAKDSNAPAGDVLAIQLGEKVPFKSLMLGDSLPVIGEKVWISAAIFEGAPPSQMQHEAVVTALPADGNIHYRFENKKLSLKGTLGAPVLNAEGKVVAIHLGAIDTTDPLLAAGNPTARFLPYLAAALVHETQSEKSQDSQN